MNPALPEAQAQGVMPARWDDAQARFYAETIEASDYVDQVAPLLGAGWSDFLDIGAGSGALGQRLVQASGRWQAVEPQPAMQALLEGLRRSKAGRHVILDIHPCTWQALPAAVNGRRLLAANVGATHHEAGVFFDAVAQRWREQMHWVVAAQAGPSTFCLAGFLPAELHGADTQPAFERTLAQLGADRRPDTITFTDWHCRFIFPSLSTAQAHFLDRLALAPHEPRAVDICRYVSRHAHAHASGTLVSCPKRSAVMSWHHH